MPSPVQKTRRLPEGAIQGLKAGAYLTGNEQEEEEYVLSMLKL